MFHVLVFWFIQWIKYDLFLKILNEGLYKISERFIFIVVYYNVLIRDYLWSFIREYFQIVTSYIFNHQNLDH